MRYTGGVPDSADGPVQPVAALLEDVLAQAAGLAQAAHHLLAPIAGRRDDLRRRLLDDGLIQPLPASPPAASGPVTLAAVDGGSVREHLYAADLMLAVATSAAGMTSAGDRPLVHGQWARVRAHEAENDRLLAAAMAALELQVLAELTHDLRILDGSHGTPVIALSTALAARSPTVAAAAAELVTADVLAAAAALADPAALPHPGRIVALPKADSAHAFTQACQDRYGLHLPGGDRFLAAQVLDPGEMLYPRVAEELAGLHVPTPVEAPQAVQQAAAALGDAVDPLRRAAQRRRLLLTYVKPSTAGTALKLETLTADPLPDSPGQPGPAVDAVARLAQRVAEETPGPFLQEPFAQHAVDLAAKSVAVSAEALHHAMLAHLPAAADG